MNIPPDGANDLNNGPRRGNAVTNAIVDICRAVIDANREWTSAHDMAVRLVGPIAVLAIAGEHLSHCIQTAEYFFKEFSAGRSKIQSHHGPGGLLHWPTTCMTTPAP